MRDTARRWAAVNEAAYRGASSPATPAALVAGAAAGIPVVSASRAFSECEDEIRGAHWHSCFRNPASLAVAGGVAVSFRGPSVGANMECVFADAAAPGDDCYKVWDIVLQEFDEPHDIAREFLARAHRSKMVAAFFFRLRREAAKTMEDISLCIHRYLLHDAIGVGDMEDSELCFKYPTSIGGRHERIPHLSWAAQHTASAGRAFTALCWARSTLQLARVAGWLLDGEEARGRDLAHAVLRQDLGAAEKARTLLQVCIGHKDHVSQLIKLLGESGHTDLVPHLVAGAAEELAHLRQCRARVATTGWVREHMRLKMDTEEQMLGALAAVVPKHTNL